jgi:hypothetical protein
MTKTIKFNLMYASGFVFVISDRSYKDSVWCTICRANIYDFLFKIGRIKILLGVLFVGLIFVLLFQIGRELFSGLIFLLLFQIGFIKILFGVLFAGLIYFFSSDRSYKDTAWCTISAVNIVFVISDRSYKDTAWYTISRVNIVLLFQIGRIKILLGALFAGLILFCYFR